MGGALGGALDGASGRASSSESPSQSPVLYDRGTPKYTTPPNTHSPLTGLQLWITKIQPIRSASRSECVFEGVVYLVGVS